MKEDENMGASTLRLIKAIEKLADKIATDIELMVACEKDAEGKQLEVSRKSVETYTKFIDKSDKIQDFLNLLATINSDGEKITSKKEQSLSKEKSKKNNIQDFVLNDKL